VRIWQLAMLSARQAWGDRDPRVAAAALRFLALLDQDQSFSEAERQAARQEVAAAIRAAGAPLTSQAVAQTQTQAALRQTNQFQFSMVVDMMLALSIIVALVGGIALMGALSIGVIERTKEIGVLRAVGARSRTILGIFVMEGILQGLLSWLIAVPVSFLASPALAAALGKAMFGATLDYQYNWTAVGVWFVVMLVISAVASLMPASGATRISVRDSLAYA
jgi:putative ABC transport system permease protein